METQTLLLIFSMFALTVVSASTLFVAADNATWSLHQSLFKTLWSIWYMVNGG